MKKNKAKPGRWRVTGPYSARTVQKVFSLRKWPDCRPGGSKESSFRAEPPLPGFQCQKKVLYTCLVLPGACDMA